MAQELECKLKISDPKALAATLHSLGADFHGRALEKNWVFDRNGELKAKWELLRLRMVGDEESGEITHKAPAPEGEYKCRIETQTKVADAASARAIFEALGYKNEWYYEKYRSHFEYLGCEVVIDEMPVVGSFIEIEAPDEATIDCILNNLGIEKEGDMKLNYRQIWRTYCEEHGLPFGDWKFTQK